MAAIPPPPPPPMGGDPLKLWRTQRHKMDLDKKYRDRNKGSDNWHFWYALAVLSPWIISVVIKLWTGEWTVW